eukprot:gb/GECG01008806.1/.p1 GENE.gb/GECG01008806.1/~~gb/GECG01008806.1/.p1  ORF type:complete len:1125 (+),score=122.01 gb/GECG01008806.1/:1-3375(+)
MGASASLQQEGHLVGVSSNQQSLLSQNSGTTAVGHPDDSVARPNHIITVKTVQAEAFRVSRESWVFVLYHIKLQCKGFQWTIHRRYNELNHLRKKYESVMGQPLPSFAQLPPRHIFKRRFNKTVIKERCRGVPNFLQYVADSQPLWRLSPDIWHFFEVSPGSFDSALGRKGREGWAYKLSGGRAFHASRFPVSNWKHRWFSLRDCAIVWYKRSVAKNFPLYCFNKIGEDAPVLRGRRDIDSEFTIDAVADEATQLPSKERDPVHGVFLVDDCFSIFFDNSKKYILLKNRTRSLVLKTGSTHEFVSWMVALSEMYRCPTTSLANPTPHTQDIFSPRIANLSKSDFRSLALSEPVLFGSRDVGAGPLCKHPNDCGFPLRRCVPVCPLVGGQDAFVSLAVALSSAQHNIFITDWWMDPNVALFRPHLLGLPADQCEKMAITLLDILVNRASNGVHVRVLLYNEVPSIMPNGSRGAERILANAHENIEVIRHPQNFAVKDVSSRIWSHHEKTAIIDERIAFVGGMDLCPGRFDTNELTPLVPDWSSIPENEQECYNPRLDAALSRYPPHVRATIDKRELPRMPWQDAAAIVGGEAALDVGFHFIRRWNHHVVQKGLKGRVQMAIPRSDLCPWWKREELRQHPLTSFKFNGLTDDEFCAFVVEHVPTRALGVLVHHLPVLRKDWAQQSQELPPCWYGPAQVLSSVSTWSTGLPGKEASIERSMCNAISDAQHYVYIENQFFLSLAGLKNADREANSSITSQYPRNKVNDALYERICRAIENDETFRAIIVVPCLPEDDDASAVLRTILYWQLQSLFIGRHALVPRLRSKLKSRCPNADDADIRKWLSVCSLAQTQTLRRTKSLERMHTHLLGAKQLDESILILEQVYVHTKVLIVDDTLAMVGSANINDRSMLGNGDSEISLRIGWLGSQPDESSSTVESCMNGKPWTASAPVQNLRIQLWKKHIDDADIADHDLQDPVSEDTYENHWLSAADENTGWCVEQFGDQFLNEHLFDVECDTVARVEGMTSDSQWNTFTKVFSDMRRLNEAIQRSGAPNTPVLDCCCHPPDEAASAAQEPDPSPEDSLSDKSNKRLLIHTPAKLWRGGCKKNIEEMLPQRFTVYDVARGALL